MCVRFTEFAQLNHAVSSLKVVQRPELEMNVVRCPSCGARMKRSGKTSARSIRWRCKACGASKVERSG